MCWEKHWKKEKFYKKKKERKKKERKKKRNNVLDSTVTVINVDHNYSHGYFTLQNEIDFLWYNLKIRMPLIFCSSITLND